MMPIAQGSTAGLFICKIIIRLATPSTTNDIKPLNCFGSLNIFGILSWFFSQAGQTSGCEQLFTEKLHIFTKRTHMRVNKLCNFFLTHMLFLHSETINADNRTSPCREHMQTKLTNVSHGEKAFKRHLGANTQSPSDQTPRHHF
jgi:hypothetical protein